VELVLPQDVGGEPVGVVAGVTLRISQDVDLAVRLLERLHDLMFLQPPAPGEDRIHRPADRVPERHAGVARERQLTAVGTDKVTFVPDPVSRRPLGDERPDQPAGDGADERVVEVALAPDVDWPGLLRQEHRVQPLALGGKHRVHVLDRCLQFLELVRVLSFHGGGH
jgi:hypothetical protein